MLEPELESRSLGLYNLTFFQKEKQPVFPGDGGEPSEARLAPQTMLRVAAS